MWIRLSLSPEEEALRTGRPPLLVSRGKVRQVQVQPPQVGTATEPRIPDALELIKIGV